MTEYIVNPRTKRKIKVNGPTFKKLYREGIISGDEPRVHKNGSSYVRKPMKKFKVINHEEQKPVQKQQATSFSTEEDDDWNFNDSDDEEPQTPLPGKGKAQPFEDENTPKKEEVLKIEEKPNNHLVNLKKKMGSLTVQEMELLKSLFTSKA